MPEQITRKLRAIKNHGQNTSTFVSQRAQFHLTDLQLVQFTWLDEQGTYKNVKMKNDKNNYAKAFEEVKTMFAIAMNLNLSHVRYIKQTSRRAHLFVRNGNGLLVLHWELVPRR